MSGGVERAVRLLAGLVLYAASMAMLVHAGLGAMPWDVLTLGIQVHTGASFGVITAVTSLVVLGCWWPLRQRPGIGTVANVVVISVLVDPALALLDLLPPLAVGWRLVLLGAGVAANAAATGLYIGARLGPGPRDGLMTGLVARTRWSVRVVKTSIEVTVVVVGWLLGGTVGIGTLVYALGVGPLIHLLLPRLTVARPGPGEPAVAHGTEPAQVATT
ncbi:MAG: hypothetical protein KJ548_12845 [Actinobacteria bacterium]|nr:hypothetical protein [Actinomycetota bacterium]MBU4337445.1 hypothetical protein [Actinomycetota bacterium]